MSEPIEALQPPSFLAAFRVWAMIGLLSFGGPAGQIALMQRELVERRRWISESRFLHALNYCMLLPGPEAQQLATYIGWLLHRTPGGLVAGGMFVLPGVAALMILSMLYVGFGYSTLVSGLFFGLKAAVLAIVIEAVIRVGRRALKSRWQVGIAAGAFVAIYAFKVPFPWIIGAAALLGAAIAKLFPAGRPTSTSVATDDSQFVVDRLAAADLARTGPSALRTLRACVIGLALWFAPVAAAYIWLGSDHVISREGTFFSQAAVVTFGGAYSVLAYVAQRAVQNFHWLAPAQMIDGLALAETTPGPPIMVLQFVGFLAAYQHAGTLNPRTAALLGALLTTWVTFVPSFLFIFVGAPYMERLRGYRKLNAALSGITAVVVGVILNLSMWFAMHTIFLKTSVHYIGLMELDVPVWASLQPIALILSAAAMIAMLRYKTPIGWTLASAAVLGFRVSWSGANERLL